MCARGSTRVGSEAESSGSVPRRCGVWGRRMQSLHQSGRMVEAGRGEQGFLETVKAERSTVDKAGREERSRGRDNAWRIPGGPGSDLGAGPGERETWGTGTSALKSLVSTL